MHKISQNLMTHYYFYHAFEVGEIGFLLSEKGLEMLDISGLYNTENSGIELDSVSKKTSENRWQVAAVKLEDVPTITPLMALKRQIIEEFAGYFAGNLQCFSIPLNMQGTPFQIAVWQALLNIPYGETISYKMLALNIDNPKAVRAVGSANGKNPLPIIIPCHRVIQSDQTLGGYSGGLATKVNLLKLEGLTISQGKSGLKVGIVQSDLFPE